MAAAGSAARLRSHPLTIVTARIRDYSLRIVCRELDRLGNDGAYAVHREESTGG
jgi:hypothetical protein